MKKLSNLNIKYYLLFLYSPIVINYLFNLGKNSITESFSEINFYDLFSTVLLFIFLYQISKEVSQRLDLPYISTGFVTYMFSFFVIDNLILFLYTGIKFAHLFIFVNVIWLTVLIYKKTNILALSKIIFGFTILNLFNNLNFNSLSKNMNILGDVQDIHFLHVKNIYANNYFYSISNPNLEGYPQLVAYFHATLNKISISNFEFNYLTSSTNVLLLLTFLLIYELDLSRITKFVFSLSFTALILNSEWLKFLFIDSLMTEGSLSYLFCVILLSLVKVSKSRKGNLFISFFLMGLLYFSKQFISTLSVLVILYYLINKKTRQYALAGIIGIFLKEISYLTYFKDINKNFHFREFDFLDTLLDLILLRDVILSNVFTILKNLSVDIPLTLIFSYWLLLTMIFFYKTKNWQKDIVFFTVLIIINFALIFILYISVLRNAELESPIRYMMNLLHLVFYSQFKIIELVSKD